MTLWGEDKELAAWLKSAGVRARPFDPRGKAREVILISKVPPGPDGAKAFEALWGRVAGGSTAVCLCPEVFRQGNDPLGHLPLKPKGKLVAFWNWLYLYDEWAKAHPIFAGLPAGGLLDSRFYRRLISNRIYVGQAGLTEAVAGAIRTSQGYDAGLLLAVHKLGTGRIVLNTLRIRENLGADPVAEQLLRNVLNYAADGKP